MRILLDCRMAAWTGVGRYTRGLVRALGERSDVELVEVVAPGAAPTSAASSVQECLGHPFSLAGALAFGRIARQIAADVVHCLHFPTPAPLRHPLVVTVHDLIPLTVPGVMPSAFKRAMYRALVQRAVAAADRIIVPSEHTARTLEEFHRASAARVRVAPEAADDFADGPVGDLPTAIDDIGRFVLAFGSTRRHKRLDVLLRAWARVEPLLGDEAALVLVGDEPPGFVADALGGAPLPRRIAWVGRVPDETLRALYARADAFVLPSSEEGFGLPALEAMAFGAPVVCSDAASLPEVVGEAALLVPPGDPDLLAEALGRVLRDPGLAEDLRARGRARAAAFTWARAAEETVSVYRELVSHEAAWE